MGNLYKNLQEVIKYVGREYTKVTDIRQSLKTKRMITISAHMPMIASGNAATDTASWMIYEKNIYMCTPRTN